MKRLTRRLAVLCVPLAAMLVTGCATGPARTPAGAAQQSAGMALGERIVASALGQLGQPYRYGGNGPEAFDCSGLVRFVHAAHGVTVPRTTSAQFEAALPVPADRLVPGDVLFFRFEGPKVSHVAIYAGGERFVHAPQSGRSVEMGRLDSWFRQRLVGAGRLYP